jgi:hypothetical protein
VWDAEVFAVTLMDVAVEDDAAIPLCGLRGVQQIAVDASRLSAATISRWQALRSCGRLCSRDER